MTSDPAPSFGVLLRSFRLAAGLTQHVLAERAGISVRTIGAIETGQQRAPHHSSIDQLARALRLSVADHARLEAALPRRTTAEPPAPARPPPTNLPASMTSFVGRDRELAEVRRLLTQTRLLTLTGAGGVGKTRLALAVARATASDYPDGVWLVELAALTDPALVPQAVARVLGKTEQPDRPLVDVLIGALAGKTLLLLDNCEHLLDACAALAEALLPTCHDLRLLVTGREPLGLAGERAWRVPSLAVPDLQALPPADALAQFDAVRLFVERAIDVQPAFALSPRNTAAIAQICSRLDGIPLAIELAAARLTVLSADQILDRLDDRFRLLTTHGRAGPPRQRTLRATLDWSHDLLAEPEQMLFRRLAVFAGGWTLAAGEAVGAGDGIDRRDVLDLLTALVAKSQVQVETTDVGEPRFRLLETVRQYAAERLEASDEAVVVRDRHAAWCLALAEDAAPQLVDETLLPALASLDAEQDNLRAALAWWAERDATAGLRLAAGLRHYWKMRSRLFEASRWCDLLLARAPGPTAARVNVLLVRAHLAKNQRSYEEEMACATEALAVSRALGEVRLIAEALKAVASAHITTGHLGPARPLLEEGVALSRASGDRQNLGDHLFVLGRLAQEEGEYALARSYLEESVALGPSAGDLRQAGWNHLQLGLVALMQGDDGRAEALLHEALAQARQVGTPQAVGVALYGLGRLAAWRGDLERAGQLVEERRALTQSIMPGRGDSWILAELGQLAYYQGDLQSAVAYLEEALAPHRAAGHRRRLSEVLHWLGRTAWRQGDAAVALAYLRESLELRRILGNRQSITECLEAVAMVAAGTGEAERAARLLGAADGLRASGGTPLPPVDRPDQEATVRTARAALGQAAYVAAWAAGRAMALVQALAEAVGTDPPVALPTSTPSKRASRVQRELLTQREREIAIRVARGLSNRQIGSDLSISERTVSTHVANVIGKLGVNGRVQVATWAVEQGLTAPPHLR